MRFLGYILGTNEELAQSNGDDPSTQYVLRIFSCGVTDNNDAFCLEGGINESESDDQPVFDRNVRILDTFYSEENCYYSENDMQDVERKL